MKRETQKGFESDNKRKIPKRKMKNKTGTGKGRCHAEVRTWKET
jgi:hypothetical protein